MSCINKQREKKSGAASANREKMNGGTVKEENQEAK
jgi:hypothetical protein